MTALPTIARPLREDRDPSTVELPSGRSNAEPPAGPERTKRSKFRLVSISRRTSDVAFSWGRLVVGVSHKRHCARAGHDPALAAVPAASIKAKTFDAPMRPLYRGRPKTGLICG